MLARWLLAYMFSLSRQRIGFPDNLKVLHIYLLKAGDIGISAVSVIFVIVSKHLIEYATQNYCPNSLFIARSIPNLAGYIIYV